MAKHTGVYRIPVEAGTIVRLECDAIAAASAIELMRRTGLKFADEKALRGYLVTLIVPTDMMGVLSKKAEDLEKEAGADFLDDKSRQAYIAKGTVPENIIAELARKDEKSIKTCVARGIVPQSVLGILAQARQAFSGLNQGAQPGLSVI